MLRKTIPLAFAILLISPAAMADDDETYLGFAAQEPGACPQLPLR